LAGFDNVDPANLCVFLSMCLAVYVSRRLFLMSFLAMFSCDMLLPGLPVHLPGRLAHDGRSGLRPYRPAPAREPDEGIPVIKEYALHRRAAVAGKVRVLTS
jgi:hypothetical protein